MIWKKCNRELLNKAIKEYGCTSDRVRRELGLSVAGYERKLKGETKFKKVEVDEIKHFLNLSDEETEKIFY